MACLSTSTPSLRKDIRSESRTYKRDKDHNSKWAHGSRALPGIKTHLWGGEPCTGTPEQWAMSRPEKKRGFHDYYGDNRHSAQKADVLHEISTGQNLSKSVTELSLLYLADNRSPDADIMYSFDASSAPRQVAKLDGLIDKAEKEWKSRETDKIINDEYAVLDGRGEVQVQVQVQVPTRGKGKGKKNSPRQRALSVASVPADEDDWERI